MIESLPPRAVAEWLPLLQEALAREGRFYWQLTGSSMTPTLQPGSDIELVPLARVPKVGEIVVFLNGESLVAHRLVRRTRARWVTQGDGRATPDPALSPSAVLGRVATARAQGRRYWPTRLESMLALGWVARYHALRALRRGYRLLWSPLTATRSSGKR